MKVQDLNKTVQNLEQSKKSQLKLKLQDLFNAIDHFEKTGEIRKEDQPKYDTLKDFIAQLVKENERI